MRALKTKNINLAERLAEAKSKRTGPRGGAVRLILPAALLLLAIGGVMGWYWLKLLPEQAAAYQQALAYVSAAENRGGYEAATQLTAERETLQAQCDSLQKALANLGGYPEWSRKLYDTLAGAVGATPVMLTSVVYHREGGALTLNARAGNARHSADFAERLRLTGQFTGISYYGYHLDDGSYAFTLDCLVLAPEGGAA